MDESFGTTAFEFKGPLMAKDQSLHVFNLHFGTADGELPDDLRV